MIQVQIFGETFFLLPYEPAAEKKQVLTPSLKTDVQVGLEGEEGRRPLASDLVLEYQFFLKLIGDEARQMAAGLQALKNHRVLCPLWPARRLFSEPSLGSTGLSYTYEQDGSHAELHVDPAPEGFVPSATALTVPVMVGQFDKEPAPVTPVPGVLQVDIVFREAGDVDYALELAAVPVPANGPVAAGKARPLFPLPIDWSRAPNSGQAHVELTRKELGFGRRPAEVYYPQVSQRIFTADVSPDGWSQIAALLAFFQRRFGQVENFWISAPHQALELAIVTTAESADITITNPSSLGDQPWLYFRGPNGAESLRRVVGKNGAVVTLDQSPGVFAPGACLVVPLLLARFKASSISIEFVTTLEGTASISFVETPLEYSAADGETDGTTRGALPLTAFLYRFFQYFPETTVVSRFTSHERDITAAGDYYTSDPAWFEHGDFDDTLEADQASLKVSTRAFVGNPLLQFMPFRLEVPLYVDVLECTPDADGVAANAKLLWRGVVAKPKFNGPNITFESAHAFRVLNTSLPSALVGPPCSKKIFSTACGLARADWTFSALVVSYDAATAKFVVQTLARPSGLPAIPANFFSCGRIYGGGGTAYYSRAIFSSTEWNGVSMEIVLGTPLDNPPAPGATVHIEPGCAHSPEACAAFGNTVRYGGHKYVPNGNPTLTAVPRTGGSGKK